MKSFSEYIKEDYSFRLGGSQQKGFDQTEAKTFAELEKGDAVYQWIDWYWKSYKFCFKRALGSKKYITNGTWNVLQLYCDGLRFNIPNVNVDESCYYKNEKDNRFVLATSFKELQCTVKKEFNIDIDEKSVKEE